MENLQIFENQVFGSIRGIEIDGEPWLFGKDVALALGYAEPQKAVREHVDDEDKGVSEMDTPGGKQSLVIINESGLYSLVFSSKLPTAKAFKRWVTSEVLPSIRKNGYYVNSKPQPDELAFEKLFEMEKRKDVLNGLVNDFLDANLAPQDSVKQRKACLHALYNALNKKRGFALEAYKQVYMTKYRLTGCTTFDTVTFFDEIYYAAVDEMKKATEYSKVLIAARINAGFENAGEENSHE